MSGGGGGLFKSTKINRPSVKRHEIDAATSIACENFNYSKRDPSRGKGKSKEKKYRRRRIDRKRSCSQDLLYKFVLVYDSVVALSIQQPSLARLIYL